MCGFVGFTGDPDEGVLHSMTTAIAHRGQIGRAHV